MAFSDDAAPTRANINKRLFVAREALESASALAAKRHDADMPDFRAELGNARAWLRAASDRMAAAKGKQEKANAG